MRALAVACAALLLPAGCASPGPPPLALHPAHPGVRTALVAETRPLDSTAALFARSRVAGALKGAALGVPGFLQALGSTSCSGDGCGPVLVVGLALAVVIGGTVGLVAGVQRATPGDEADAIDRAIERSVAELPAHLDLSRRLLAAAESEAEARLEPWPETASPPELDALRARGFARVLEVGVRRLAFGGGGGSDPELALEIEAHARLVDTRSGAVDYERSFRSVGLPQRFSAWVANAGGPLRTALATGLDALAESIASAFLAQADLGIASGTWRFPGTPGYGACWLVPLDPPIEYGFLSQELGWPTIPAARATLRWQPFPSERERARIERASGEQLRDVSYDLRIWEVRGEERGALAYERRALDRPEHALEQPLAPRHRYFWSARACFALGGARACTPWASSLVPSRGGRVCEHPEIPAWNHYRFVTR